MQHSNLIPDFGQTDAFAERLRSGDRVDLSSLFMEAILALEAAMASEARVMEVAEFAQVAVVDEPSQIAFVWSSSAPRFSQDVANVALMGVSELLAEAIGQSTEPSTGGFAQAHEGLRKRARKRRLAASNTVLIQAARERGIPAARVGVAHVRIGEGRFQTMFRSASTTATSYAATRLSINKRLTNRRLKELRLPVPKQLRATTPQKAVLAAEKIGYPVVVKPTKGSRGSGITVGAKTPGEVRDAFHKASIKKPDVVIEQFLEGDDHRLLVVGDRCVAAVKRIPPSIFGDGKLSIAELIDQLNQDPFRDNFRMFQLANDTELESHLERYGYQHGDVLEQGVQLPLRSVSNVSKGGIPIDVSDEVHPLNKDAAVRAAHGMGLDVAGVDIIATDISKPYTETGGCINEVNARPGLDLHRFPRHGEPRDVAGDILDHVYPDASPASVDKTIIVGDRRTAAVARDVEAFLRESDRAVGLAIRDTAYVNGHRQVLTKRQHHKAARLLLRDPDIESLVATASPRDIISRGLQFQKTDVVVVMPPAEKTDPDEYQAAIAVALKSDPCLVVVDNDNDLALAELASVPRAQVALVSHRGATPRMHRHLNAGGCGAFVEIRDGQRSVSLTSGTDEAHTIPVTVAEQGAMDPHQSSQPGTEATGRRSRRISTRLYASAVVLALGLSPDEIAEAIARSPAITK